jgi:hypothetical protein
MACAHFEVARRVGKTKPGIKYRAFRSGRLGFLAGGRQLYRPFQEVRHVVAEGEYRRVAF